MRTFRDEQGRSWDLRINVATLRRVRDECKVNLLDVLDGTVQQRLGSDPILLADVLYCLIRPYAEERKISASDFGESLAGDSIEAATTCLMEELADFFPSSRRKFLREALKKAREIDETSASVALAKLEQVEPATALRQLGASSGRPPESVDSTQDHSPSAS